jgi:D-alanyl-D-alanine carboxypeptidase
MSYREPSRSGARRAGAALLLAVVAIVGVSAVLAGIGHQSSALSPSAPVRQSHMHPPGTHDGALRDRPAAVGESDGFVPGTVSVFDELPAVANLDPDLLAALRTAATAAADDAVTIDVNSGWRSPAYQQRLLDEAVEEYGSTQEAARWVATPTTSAHVSGDAVDVGPADATDWLSEHGADYGLCQTYDNEPWHYELRSGAAEDGCPAPYADPTHDPRMQQ